MEIMDYSCLYFGFASNLSPRTLQQRCPGSLFVGLGVLHGWKFVISELGFGNIVPGAEDDQVYGSLSFLTAQHEAALDKTEEVPKWHQKQKLKVTMMPSGKPDDGWQAGQEVEATTYIDTKRKGEGVISKEYVIWMRKAVADGLTCGVPQSYFDKYVMKFLPEDATVGHEDKIIMVRTSEMDKEDLSHVPAEVLSLASTKDKRPN